MTIACDNISTNEFHYYKKLKILVVKTTRVCKLMYFVTTWVKSIGLATH